MLAIRFLRSGRKNRAFFRIVLTENSRPPKSNYIKELGWFDPHSKETSLKTEEILKYLNSGAKPSNSVAKLLLENKVKHKQIVYTPDTPKEKRGKKDEPKKAMTPSAEKIKDENATEPSEEAKISDAKAEDTPEEETAKPADSKKEEKTEEKVEEAKTEPEKES